MYKPKKKTHFHSHKVYFGDTDAAGVVYYANYLRFFEIGRIEYLAAAGYPYKSLRSAGFGLVPVHVDMNYHNPLRFEDIFKVSASLTRLTRASVTMYQTIIRDKTLCCEATIKLASLNEDKFKLVKLPDQFIRTIEKYESDYI